MKDNGVTVAAANIASIDYLFGQVTFVGGYTVTGPVTMDASYIPTATITEGEGRRVQLRRRPGRRHLVRLGGLGRKLLALADISGSLMRLALPSMISTPSPVARKPSTGG